MVLVSYDPSAVQCSMSRTAFTLSQHPDSRLVLYYNRGYCTFILHVRCDKISCVIKSAGNDLIRFLSWSARTMPIQDTWCIMRVTRKPSVLYESETWFAVPVCLICSSENGNNIILLHIQLVSGYNII